MHIIQIFNIYKRIIVNIYSRGYAINLSVVQKEMIFFPIDFKNGIEHTQSFYMYPFWRRISYYIVN